jgi:uncharacterized protein (DUF488 family)
MTQATTSRLFTVGYQTHSLATLMKTLSGNRVSLVMDVRQNPVSRKQGFSRKQLEATVLASGIAYIHCPELGTPPKIRNMYLSTSNTKETLRLYEVYLRKHGHILRLLLKEIRVRSVCLLCLEADHNSCHRSIIAQLVTEMTGCQPIHLR